MFQDRQVVCTVRNDGSFLLRFFQSRFAALQAVGTNLEGTVTAQCRQNGSAVVFFILHLLLHFLQAAQKLLLIRVSHGNPVHRTYGVQS